MVDKEKINTILEERKKAHINWPWMERDFWHPLRDALGDDEDEILEYLNGLDDDTASWFSEIYEEVVEKFPSTQMSEVFERINNI